MRMNSRSLHGLSGVGDGTVVVTASDINAALTNYPTADKLFNPCPDGGTWQGVNAAGMNVCSGVEDTQPTTAEQLAVQALTQGPPPGGTGGNMLPMPPVISTYDPQAVINAQRLLGGITPPVQAPACPFSMNPPSSCWIPGIPDFLVIGAGIVLLAGFISMAVKK